MLTRLILIGREALMEILGLLEPCSPNPRRNTSKSIFEVSRGGNNAETCCHIVASSLPLCCQLPSQQRSEGNKVATNRYSNAIYLQ